MINGYYPAALYLRQDIFYKTQASFYQNHAPFIFISLDKITLLLHNI